MEIEVVVIGYNDNKVTEAMHSYLHSVVINSMQIMNEQCF